MMCNDGDNLTNKVNIMETRKAQKTDVITTKTPKGLVGYFKDGFHVLVIDDGRTSNVLKSFDMTLGHKEFIALIDSQFPTVVGINELWDLCEKNNIKYIHMKDCGSLSYYDEHDFSIGKMNILDRKFEWTTLE